MKRLVKISALAALAVSLAFSTVACSDGDDDDSTTPAADSTTPAAEDPSGTVNAPDTDPSQSNDNPTTTTTPTETPAAEQTVSVTSAWNFKEGANASANATIKGYGTTATKPTSEITIDADSGSGATLKLLVQNGCSVKYSTGLQWSAGTKETDVMKITTDEACTLEVVGKGSSGESSFSTAKPNSFSVNGTSVYARTEASDTKEQTWTVSLNKGDNTIAVSGMKFISFTCK